MFQSYPIHRPTKFVVFHASLRTKLMNFLWFKDFLVNFNSL